MFNVPLALNSGGIDESTPKYKDKFCFDFDNYCQSERLNVPEQEAHTIPSLKKLR